MSIEVSVQNNNTHFWIPKKLVNQKVPIIHSSVVTIGGIREINPSQAIKKLAKYLA